MANGSRVRPKQRSWSSARAIDLSGVRVDVGTAEGDAVTASDPEVGAGGLSVRTLSPGSRTALRRGLGVTFVRGRPRDVRRVRVRGQGRRRYRSRTVDHRPDEPVGYGGRLAVRYWLRGVGWRPGLPPTGIGWCGWGSGARTGRCPNRPPRGPRRGRGRGRDATERGVTSSKVAALVTASLLALDSLLSVLRPEPSSRSSPTSAPPRRERPAVMRPLPTGSWELSLTSPISLPADCGQACSVS